MSSISHDTILALYGNPITLPHYLIINLFRILRPMRHKYKLTINELVVLTGMYNYNKLVSSSFSASNTEKYIGYFNSNKIKYYIRSLAGKDVIKLSDKLNGYDRYKITDKGITVLNDLEMSYAIALKKFIEDNKIVL